MHNTKLHSSELCNVRCTSRGGGGHGGDIELRRPTYS